MNFNQLQYFHMAAQEENFTKAAEMLHMTQPALSKTIGRLEEELGVGLFERNGKLIRLSDAGKLFFDWTTSVLDSYEHMLQEIDVSGRKGNQTIKIAFSGIVFSSPIIMKFEQNYPGIDVDEALFSNTEFPEILDEADVVLSSKNYCASDVESMLLFREPLCFVCPKEHWLASKGFIHMSDLMYIPIIFPKENNLFREQVEKIFADAGCDLMIAAKYQRDHWRNAVVSGMGCAIVAESTTKTFNYSEDKCRVVYFMEDNCQRNIYALWKRKKKYPYGMTCFQEYLNKRYIEHKL